MLKEARHQHENNFSDSDVSGSGSNTKSSPVHPALRPLSCIQSKNLFQKLHDSQLLLPLRMKHNSEYFETSTHEDWNDRMDLLKETVE